MPRRDRAQIDIRPALPAVSATLDKSLAKSGTELPEIVVDTGNPACPQTNPDRVTTLNSTAPRGSSAGQPSRGGGSRSRSQRRTDLANLPAGDSVRSVGRCRQPFSSHRPL